MSLLSPGFGDSLYQRQNLRGGPSLHEMPGVHQQYHISSLQVLSAVGTQQPCGVAQHTQDAPVQQMVGHVCIHSGQRVVEEIQFLFLVDGTGKGYPGPLSPAEGYTLLSDLCLVSSRQDAEVIIQGTGLQHVSV